MKYAVLFEDNPDAGEVRKPNMPAHLAFLEANASAIVAAGPLFEAEGSAAGGLWLVDAQRESEVRRLVEADPFWPAGLRKSVRILQWFQVFADGKRRTIEEKQ